MFLFGYLGSTLKAFLGVLVLLSTYEVLSMKYEAKISNRIHCLFPFNLIH